MPELIPVEDNPFNVNLVPVEGNPFALQGDVGAARQQQNATEAAQRGTTSNPFHSTRWRPWDGSAASSAANTGHVVR